MEKRTRRIILWSTAGLLTALVVAGVLLYLEASGQPHDYTPILLSLEDRDLVRQAMNQRLFQFGSLAGEVGSWDPRQAGRAHHPHAASGSGTADPGCAEANLSSTAEGGRATSAANGSTVSTSAVDAAPDPAAPVAGTFTITQEEVNQWLSAASGQVAGPLAAQGLSQPAIAFGPGRLTFYGRLDRLAAVVGVDVSLNFDDMGQMTVQIDSARIGRIPLPEAALRQYKAQLIRRLRDQAGRLSAAPASGGQEAIAIFGRAATGIAAALDGKPVSLDIRQHFGNVRIRRITLEEGRCTLELAALDRPGATE
jgi:hypothetical protein